MRVVKFDGPGFIGFRYFAVFVVDFFLYGQDIFDQNVISIILHCHWCWYNMFLMTIISSEDSIPKCGFKLPEVCDIIEKCMPYGQDRTLLCYIVLSNFG